MRAEKSARTLSAGAKGRLLAALKIYIIFWGLTAIATPPLADRDFDREFASGSVGLDPGSRPVAVERVPFVSVRRPDELPETPPWAMTATGRWRCRTRGVPIAPFLLIDEANWQTHSLAGFSGRRLVFWCLWRTFWIPLEVFWVS